MQSTDLSKYKKPLTLTWDDCRREIVNIECEIRFLRACGCTQQEIERWNEKLVKAVTDEFNARCAVELARQSRLKKKQGDAEKKAKRAANQKKQGSQATGPKK
jgi:hypothetical protein